MYDDEIRRLQRLIDTSRRIVGFTGAGISTESGIPDYRSAGGLWDTYTPVYFEEFLRDPDKRILYWQRKRDLWPKFRDAQPNSGHIFFRKLLEEGQLLGIITQNIDGVHEKSGIPREMIVNLHGTNSEVLCLSCGKVYPAADVFDRLDLEGEGPPRCSCGGWLKPNTISFGQNLRLKDLERAEKLARICDLMIVLGSTLVVYPAAGFPETARENEAGLAIVTLSDTPLDPIADVVVHAPIGEVVQRLRVR